MDVDDPRKSIDLVRMYSIEVEQRISDSDSAYPLSQALILERENLERLAAPWRALLDPADLTDSNASPITKVVAKESQRLRTIWRTYQATCPVEERIDLDHIDPTVHGIVQLVNAMLESWDEKRKKGWWGRVKEKFHRVCSVLDSHRSLLEVLPQQNDYVSILYGSFTAIVRASVNHEGLVEDLIMAMSDISNRIEDCAVDLNLYNTTSMKESIADLYSAIFNFLAHVSEWIMKNKAKRLGRSFDEGLRTKFQEKIETIQSKSESIAKYAAQNSRVEGRATRLAVYGISNSIRSLDRSLSEEQVQIKELLSQLSESVKSLLLQQSSRFVDEQRIDGSGGHPLYTQVWAKLPSNESALSVVDVTNMEGTLNSTSKCSQNLERFFSADRLCLSAEGFHADGIPPQMIMRLSEWVQADTADSSTLWLQGWPATLAEDQENSMAMFAAKFAELVSQIDRPGGQKLRLISYFCQISREKPREGNSSHEAEEAVALAYALLHQIIDKLISTDDSLSELSRMRLDGLDGTVRTWQRAMQMLQALLPLASVGSFCVIDGLHWVDHYEAEPLGVELVSILSESKLKVLFTTSGRCGALLEVIPPHQILQVIEDED